MDEDDKARLARQGLSAAELLEPGKLSGKIGASVSGAAKGVALRTIAVVGRLAGGKSREPQQQPLRQEGDDGGLIEMIDASDAFDFHAQLSAAKVRQADQQSRQQVGMAELRKSFPAESKQLALLVFSCVELLEEVADGGGTLSAEERARKEKLLEKVAALLAQNAGAALTSFVEHVVTTSRAARENAGG